MKIKHVFAVAVAAVLLFLASMLTVSYVVVNAETPASEETESEPAQEPAETPAETPAEPQEGAGEGSSEPSDDEAQSEETDALQTLIDGFLSQLKAKYGDEWQKYYDKIISEWGTVEEYLLALMPQDAPDVVKSGWEQFIEWTNDYKVLIAAVAAVGIVLFAALFGRKKVKDVLSAFSKQKSLAEENAKKTFEGMNLLYQNAKAQNDAIMALLGDNPKFADKKDALQKSNEEMMK